MSDRLKGRIALITGGTSGIGEATVKLFVAEGAQVVFTGRDQTRAKALTAECGARAQFFAADSRDESQIAAAVEATSNWHGRLDVLFNNAGAPVRGDVETLTGEEFRGAFDLLVGSVLFGMKHAAPVMKRQKRGAIINNSSVAALRGHMGGYLYSTAKAAVRQATKMAGLELGPYGITVNSVAPGGIATPIFLGGSDVASSLSAEANATKIERLKSNLSKATPVRRHGTPHDIAEAVLFLSTDAGVFVNCHDLVVDGGMTAGGRVDYS